ncbi:hypothetical protein OG216_46315 (plasmid) [Streptomycetaceae bacterium NBC_01309]
MVDVNAIPNWPVVRVGLGEQGALTVDGEVTAVEAGQDARSTAVERAARLARQLGRPVRVEAEESDGTLFRLIVDEDGGVAESGPAVPPRTNRRLPFRRRGDTDAEPPTTAVVPPPPTNEQALDVESITRLVRVPAPAAANAPVPAAVPPRPTPEQAAVLVRVRRLAEDGTPGLGIALLQELEAADAWQASAIRDVRAYLTLADGRPAAAMHLYLRTAAELADLRGDADRRAEVDRWARTILDCAHHCWLQVRAPDEAHSLGAQLVKAYDTLGLAQAPAARAARRRQKDMRLRFLTAVSDLADH